MALTVGSISGILRGGLARSRHRSQLVTDHAHLDASCDEQEWAAVIARIDAGVHDNSGQCALVVAAVCEGMIVGAGAGGSGEWFIH